MIFSADIPDTQIIKAYVAIKSKEAHGCPFLKARFYYDNAWGTMFSTLVCEEGCGVGAEYCFEKNCKIIEKYRE